MPTLYPGHFSELCLQQANCKRWNNVSLQNKEWVYFGLVLKAVSLQTQGSSPTIQTHHMHSIQHWPFLGMSSLPFLKINPGPFYVAYSLDHSPDKSGCRVLNIILVQSPRISLRTDKVLSHKDDDHVVSYMSSPSWPMWVKMKDIMGLCKFCKNALSHMYLTLLSKRSGPSQSRLKKGDGILGWIHQFQNYGRRRTMSALGEGTPHTWGGTKVGLENI